MNISVATFGEHTKLHTKLEFGFALAEYVYRYKLS